MSATAGPESCDYRYVCLRLCIRLNKVDMVQSRVREFHWHGYHFTKLCP